MNGTAGATEARTDVNASHLPPGPRLWSESHVATWLGTKNLGRYGASFIENGINGETLLELDDETINALIPQENNSRFRMDRNHLKRTVKKLKNPRKVEQPSGPIPDDVVSFDVKLPNEDTIENMVSPADRLTMQHTVRMVKRAIIAKAQWNWEAEKAKLHFAGRDLCLDQTLADARVTSGGTIRVTIEKALPRDHPLLVVGIDIITREEGANARMPCNHVIGSESLTQYVRSIASAPYATTIKCPAIVSFMKRCDRVWEWPLCRSIGQFTLDECKEFETRFAKKTMQSQFGDVRSCPKCHSTIIKPPTLHSNRICCPNCIRIARQNRTPPAQDFCWVCLRTWRGNNEHCGNDCYPMRDLTEILASAPRKQIGKVKDVPGTRACPDCKMLIYHDTACKHMDCIACHTEFCFVCLAVKTDRGWPCGEYDDECPIASPQRFEDAVRN